MVDIQNTVGSLNRDGYAVLNDIIAPELCKTLVPILESAHHLLYPLYSGNPKSTNRTAFHEGAKIVYNLHNKNPAFLDFIDPEPVFDVVETFLQQGSYKNSDPIVLRQNTGRTPLPGGNSQKLHIDSRIPGGNFPLMAVVTWMLEDFTKINGATRVVPQSHRRKEFPPDDKKVPEELIITGKRGSVLIMDGALWHGSGANRSNGTRWSILSTYVPWFFKAAFDFSQNMPRELYNQLSPRQCQVMGYTSRPPVDEFTRVSARSNVPETPAHYSLPPTKNT